MVMSVLNKQLLKKELLESPFIQLATKKLKSNDEVIAVLLAGSRAANTASETSDIDIAILTSNSWDLEPELRGSFQDIHLHWWITPFDFSLKAWKHPKFIPLLLTGNYFMSFEEEDRILVPEKYIPFIEFLKETRDTIKPIIISNLLDVYEDQISIWESYEKFPFKKTYTPLIDFYWEQNKLVKNNDLLIKAKLTINSSKVKLADEEQAEIRKALLWVANWGKNNEYSSKQSLLEWQLQAEQILNECKKS